MSGPSLNIGGLYTRYGSEPLESTRQDVNLFSQYDFSARTPMSGLGHGERLGAPSPVGLMEQIGGLAPWNPQVRIERTASLLSGDSAGAIGHGADSGLAL